MSFDYYEGWYENVQSDEFEYSYHDAIEEDFEEYPRNAEWKIWLLINNMV